ncbi:hypothetical protein ACFLZF_00480 [Nanoarchaeota archaeon]
MTETYEIFCEDTYRKEYETCWAREGVRICDNFRGLKIYIDKDAIEYFLQKDKSKCKSIKF